jgi:hypothetical protein
MGTKKIELSEINTQTAEFEIEGITPLIVNKFSNKAANAILDKHMKKETKAKEAKRKLVKKPLKYGASFV